MAVFFHEPGEPKEGIAGEMAGTAASPSRRRRSGLGGGVGPVGVARPEGHRRQLHGQHRGTPGTEAEPAKPDMAFTSRSDIASGADPPAANAARHPD